MYDVYEYMVVASRVRVVPKQYIFISGWTFCVAARLFPIRHDERRINDDTLCGVACGSTHLTGNRRASALTREPRCAQQK